MYICANTKTYTYTKLLNNSYEGNPYLIWGRARDLGWSWAVQDSQVDAPHAIGLVILFLSIPNDRSLWLCSYKVAYFFYETMGR